MRISLQYENGLFIAALRTGRQKTVNWYLALAVPSDLIVFINNRLCCFWIGFESFVATCWYTKGELLVHKKCAGTGLVQCDRLAEFTVVAVVVVTVVSGVAIVLNSLY